MPLLNFENFCYFWQPMNRILISDSSNESSIDDLLRAAGSYFLSEEQAKRILSEVQAAMRQWRKVATACHISPAEQQRFASRLDLFI